MPGILGKNLSLLSPVQINKVAQVSLSSESSLEIAGRLFTDFRNLKGPQRQLMLNCTVEMAKMICLLILLALEDLYLPQEVSFST